MIDRTNGQFISAYPFATVTWAKEIDQKTGGPVESEIARFGPDGVHNWHAMSFNPITKLVYLPGNESSFFYKQDPNFLFKPNDASMNWGIVLGGPGGGGFLLAWDPVAQKDVWRHRTGSFGGSLTTAGGLVFAGTNDRTFHARA